MYSCAQRTNYQNKSYTIAWSIVSSYIKLWSVINDFSKSLLPLVIEHVTNANDK